jgi:hypothetical protein
MRNAPRPRRSLFAAILVSLLAAPACLTIDAPAGYVPLDNPGDKAFAAVSARGTTFAMSDRPNAGKSNGTLDFWRDALKHEKITLGRYRLSGDEPLRTDAGWDGRLLDLRLGRGAAEYTWLVALFVDPGRIVTIEAGGPSAQVSEDRDRLVAAMKSLR